MKVIHDKLSRHIKEDIIPVYRKANRAHSPNHIEQVIDYALDLAEELDVDMNITYAAAAYHDIGIIGWGFKGQNSKQDFREEHHLYSASAVRESKKLNELFNKDEVEIIASACLNHRASNPDSPVTIYGKIVADSDRLDGFDLDVLFRRCYEYDKYRYPEKNLDQIKEDIFKHVEEKYSYFGYAYDSLYLPFTKSKFSKKIERVKKTCSDRKLFEREFNKWCGRHLTQI